jgi:hypothetical protein
MRSNRRAFIQGQFDQGWKEWVDSTRPVFSALRVAEHSTMVWKLLRSKLDCASGSTETCWARRN